MPPEKLVALTHCLRAALLAGSWDEANLLLSERHSVVQEILDEGRALSPDQKERIAEADRMLSDALKEKRSSLRERVKDLSVATKIVRAYKAR